MIVYGKARRRRGTPTLLPLLLAGTSVVAMGCSLSHAQEYPAKPVRIIVGFPPGGANDIIARIAAQKLGEGWSQQFIVDNRPGASATIGTDAVARAAPDGYTLGLVSLSPLVLSKFTFAKLPYDGLADFAPITTLAMAPMVIAVHPALPATSLKALIALAQAQPGRIDFALSGGGGMTHMVMELFRGAAGVQIQTVPYKGATPALTDALAGHVQGMVEAFPVLYPPITQGRMRGIAITGERRHALLPNLATTAEQGLREVVAVNWFGMVAPARTPRAIVEKLHAALVKMPAQADVNERFGALGLEAMTMPSPDAYAAMIKSDMVRWGKIAQSAGIKPQ